VDVRDLAHAHVRAAEVPSAAGRYLCAQPPSACARSSAGCARPASDAGTRLPSSRLDHPWATGWYGWTRSAGRPGAASYLRTHIGRTPRFDARRIREELAVELRPTAQTILDTMADLAAHGHVPARPRRRRTAHSPHPRRHLATARLVAVPPRWVRCSTDVMSTIVTARRE
jgi:dihydroflavonol-4-reductase